MTMQARRPGFVILSVLLTILIIVVILNSVLLRTALNLSLVADRADALQLAVFHQSAVSWVRRVLYQDQIHFPFTSPNSLIETPLHDMPVGPGFLSGYIEDAQAKWNINNIFVFNQIDPAALAVLRRILVLDHCSPTLADAVVQWHQQHPQAQFIDFAELLTVSGFSQDILRALSPDVTVLPEATLVNINAATETVLRALLPTATDADIHQLMIFRSSSPIIRIARIFSLMPHVPMHVVDTSFIVKSDYFILHGQARLHQVTTAVSALFHRIAAAMPIVVWQRLSF